MPRGVAVFDDNRLGRFVAYIKAFGNRIGNVSVFDDKNQPAGQVFRGFCELVELLVGLAADRTLRAMLENKNGVRFRALHELFEISILS
jgi:hypothetical protein